MANPVMDRMERKWHPVPACNAMSVAAQAGIPVMLWGNPGTGKTSNAYEFFEYMGLRHTDGYESLTCSAKAPEDLGGWPTKNDEDGTMVLYPPDWAKRLVAANEKHGKCGLFLDEATQNPPSIQRPLNRIVLEHVVADLKMPDNLMIVLAGNDPDVATGGFDISAPLANRMCHLDWEVPVSFWADGMRKQSWTKGYDYPVVDQDKFEEYLPEWYAKVAAYGERNQAAVNAMPDNPRARGRAWASARTWEAVAKLMAACSSLGLTPHDEVTGMLVVGMVGNGAGMEFLAWLQSLRLPDPEDLLKAPGNAQDVFEHLRPDEVYVALGTLIRAVGDSPTNKRCKAGLDVTLGAANAGFRDVAATAAGRLIQRRPKGMKIPNEVLDAFLPLFKAAGLLS